MAFRRSHEQQRQRADDDWSDGDLRRRNFDYLARTALETEHVDRDLSRQLARTAIKIAERS